MGLILSVKVPEKGQLPSARGASARLQVLPWARGRRPTLQILDLPAPQWRQPTPGKQSLSVHAPVLSPWRTLPNTGAEKAAAKEAWASASGGTRVRLRGGGGGRALTGPRAQGRSRSAIGLWRLVSHGGGGRPGRPRTRAGGQEGPAAPRLWGQPASGGCSRGPPRWPRSPPGLPPCLPAVPLLPPGLCPARAATPRPQRGAAEPSNAQPFSPAPVRPRQRRDSLT